MLNRKDAKGDVQNKIMQDLKKRIAGHKLVEVGPGVEAHYDVSRSLLKGVANKMIDDGYKFFNIPIEPLGMPNCFRMVSVLAGPDCEMTTKDCKGGRQ